VPEDSSSHWHQMKTYTIEPLFRGGIPGRDPRRERFILKARRYRCRIRREVPNGNVVMCY
jgi:hypothetical protein